LKREEEEEEEEKKNKVLSNERLEIDVLRMYIHMNIICM